MTTADDRAPVIRTPDQRLRVFVSSTLGELAPERVAVRAAVEQLRLIPVMFELGARPHPPAQLYRAYLDQSHVFVGLYWERYGWVAPDEVVSGLEDEFLRSVGMPRLMYIKEPAPNRERRLDEMIGRLADHPESSYRRFATPDELAALVESDLAVLLTERFEASWQANGDAARFTSSTRDKPPPLPVPLTPTVGRDDDVAALAQTLASGARLVTITGVGGVGKTRVANEVGRAVGSIFDEVRFVRLGDVVDHTLVMATVAAAMGVPVERTHSAFDSLAAAIDDDRLLLILDNLEQVVDAGPELTELLNRCPSLHVLATSRHLLRLRGEHEYPLAPLPVPESDIEDRADALDRMALEPAVALFVEHATAARPAFRLDASNAAAVAELSRRLDGLPLAIELVAARIRLLPPAALLERLDDRLGLLAGSSADLPDRQRTMRATLDWSHRLLDPAEQALFARLAVFAGGASLDAVEAVCGGEPIGDVLDTLSSLLEKSLVVTVADSGVGPRIAMLQTVRAYAWEQLGATAEMDALRSRHADWFHEFARSCDPAHVAGATARWAALDADVPNVRAAVAWLDDQDDVARLADAAASLFAWYWITGRMSEARVWIEGLSRWLDEPGEATGADRNVQAQLCAAIGATRLSSGDFVGAVGLLRQAIGEFDATGDAGSSAIVASLLSASTPADTDLTEALRLAELAVGKARHLNLDWALAYALAVLGRVTRRAGSPEGMTAQLEALAIARRVGEPTLIGEILGQIAIAAVYEGDFDEAEQYLAEAVEMCRTTHHMEATVFCLEVAAELAAADQRHRDAAIFLGAGDAIRAERDIPVWPTMKARRTRLTGLLTEALGSDEFATALEDGTVANPYDLLSSPE